MKKLALSIFIMGSFGLYALSQSQSNASATFVASQPIALSTKNQTATTAKKVAVGTATTATSQQSSTTTTVKKSGLYSDGTYTGSVADAYYGNVQVQAVVSNGKIVDVRFLDYPQDRGTSIRINSVAMPYLTQEAIQAQSANVNGVSGASDTSAAFRQSLASALVKARA